jgi:hypothetical protein
MVSNNHCGAPLQACRQFMSSITIPLCYTVHPGILVTCSRTRSVTQHFGQLQQVAIRAFLAVYHQLKGIDAQDVA